MNLSHPVQTARYLTVAAAACLNHGLQKSPAASGWVLVLRPVAYAQVAEHVKANCPDISNLLLKLQGKAGSKYFTIGKAHVSEPVMIALDVSVIITPPQRRHVNHILANLELAPLVQSNQIADLKTTTSLSTTQLAPSYSTGSTQISETSQVMRPSSACAVLTVLRPVPGVATLPNSSSDVSACRCHCTYMPRHQNFVSCLKDSRAPACANMLENAATLHLQAVTAVQSFLKTRPRDSPQTLCLSFNGCAFLVLCSTASHYATTSAGHGCQGPAARCDHEKSWLPHSQMADRDCCCMPQARPDQLHQCWLATTSHQMHIGDNAHQRCVA